MNTSDRSGAPGDDSWRAHDTTASFKPARRVSFYRWLRQTWLHSIVFCTLLYATFWLVAVLPAGLALAMGRFWAWVAYCFDRRGRRVALSNLTLAFPDWSDAQRKDLIRRNYRHMGIVSAEFCRFMRYSREDLHALLVPEPGALETARLALAEGKGVIVAAAHMGNWELVVIALREMGLDALMVIRPLSAVRLERLVSGIRSRFGLRLVPRVGAPRALLRALRQGLAVAVHSDFHGGRKAPVVPFFGHPAYSFAGAAWLHVKTGAPLLSVQALRRPDGRYTWRVIRLKVPELTGTNDEKVLAILKTIGAHFEELIREFPEQWVWRHRRWRVGVKLAAPQSAL